MLPGKKKIFLLNILAFTCCLIVACTPFTQSIDNKCIVYRAAFDIGSQTTKMKVSRVNICRQRIEEMVYKNEAKVPYAENQHSGAFSPQIRQRGIITLMRLKNEAMTYRAESFSGAATESFREASDSAEFLQEVREQTGIPIKLIDQDQEAILGYLAAVSALPARRQNIIVWDIGGASMQMILHKEKNRYVIYRGKMASVSFKENILKQIKRQKPDGHSSPNPIGKNNIKSALEIASNAAGDVPDEIKKAIHDTDTLILGIGGVHNKSIKNQLKSNGCYTREEIINAVHARAEWTDNDIGGQYADIEISNLILVLGFMEKLGIKKIIPINVNLADGILINPEFW